MNYIFFFIGSKLAQIWPISGSQFAANLFRLSTNRPQHEQVLVLNGRGDPENRPILIDQ